MVCLYVLLSLTRNIIARMQQPQQNSLILQSEDKIIRLFYEFGWPKQWENRLKWAKIRYVMVIVNVLCSLK